MNLRDILKSEKDKIYDNDNFWETINHFQRNLTIVPQDKVDTYLPPKIIAKSRELIEAIELLDFNKFEQLSHELEELLKEWLRVIDFLLKQFADNENPFINGFALSNNPLAEYIKKALLIKREIIQKKKENTLNDDNLRNFIPSTSKDYLNHQLYLARFEGITFSQIVSTFHIADANDVYRRLKKHCKKYILPYPPTS